MSRGGSHVKRLTDGTFELSFSSLKALSHVSSNELLRFSVKYYWTRYVDKLEWPRISLHVFGLDSDGACIVY